MYFLPSWTQQSPWALTCHYHSVFYYLFEGSNIGITVSIKWRALPFNEKYFFFWMNKELETIWWVTCSDSPELGENSEKPMAWRDWWIWNVSAWKLTKGIKGIFTYLIFQTRKNTMQNPRLKSTPFRIPRHRSDMSHLHFCTADFNSAMKKSVL